LIDGQVVPLLGAGVNLCGRHDDEGWEDGRALPNGQELAALLARKVPGYPPSVLEDLLRVSQCVDHKLGWRPLYMTLHDLFDRDYEPTALHRLLAEMPKSMASLERPPRETHLLLVTTNYDDVLERALNDAGEQYDLVWYVARGDHMGKFMHQPPGADPVVIDDPDQYVEPLNLAERSVVLKIHGAVDRTTGDNDSYVITEDNYIDYLTRTDIRKLIPKGIAAKLRNSNILFLGYSLRDWNLRVVLNRVDRQLRERDVTSWAIDAKPSVLEARFWQERGVEVYKMTIDEFLDGITSV